MRIDYVEDVIGACTSHCEFIHICFACDYCSCVFEETHYSRVEGGTVSCCQLPSFKGLPLSIVEAQEVGRSSFVQILSLRAMVRPLRAPAATESMGGAGGTVCEIYALNWSVDSVDRFRLH